ncbi:MULTISPECIES: hypothetical protein [Pantoea]|uniref:Colicin V synthesis protein n=1 Tax=Pantoea brenneri TaxID=472694 RepID=A0ABU9MUF0_9GAMM|nr:hypothetical protein [Pantoea sp. 3.5.1]KKD30643.1 hypothetical protein EP46_20005 [Pantoea sp. 3.5.1]
MRELKAFEVNAVSGAYGDNVLANIAEGAVCAIGGAVVGAWTLAILGGRGANSSDLIGIGGGLTSLVGMIGGAIAGAVAGAVYGPFIGYEEGLVMVKGLLTDLMKGLPGG